MKKLSRLDLVEAKREKGARPVAEWGMRGQLRGKDKDGNSREGVEVRVPRKYAHILVCTALDSMNLNDDISKLTNKKKMGDDR